MSKIKVETQKALKPSPNIDLKGKIGSKLVGVFKKRIPNVTFPGKFSSLIEVEETDGSTTLYNKETKLSEEVEIKPGDTVFLKESTVLQRAFDQIPEGAKVEVIYLGTGTAKKGQKAPYLYDVNLFDGE